MGDECRTAPTTGDVDRFPLRVSRLGAVVDAGEGRPFVIHAAAPCVHHSHHVFTACGRLMVNTNDHDAGATTVTCEHCISADPRRYRVVPWLLKIKESRR